MCNNCGNSSCFGGCQQCYPSIPNQWPSCPPIGSCGTIVPCPPSNPPLPFNGIYSQFARIATTPVEIFGMPTTPKTLIGAPGAGKMILPLQIMNILKFGTTPYQDITPAIPGLTFNYGSNIVITDNTILGAGLDITKFYTMPPSLIGTFSNLPFTVSTLTQPVVGDSQLFTYIIYVIISI